MTTPTEPPAVVSCPTFKITLKLKQGWNAVMRSVDAVTAEGDISANTICTVSKLRAPKS